MIGLLLMFSMGMASASGVTLQEASCIALLESFAVISSDENSDTVFLMDRQTGALTEVALKSSWFSKKIDDMEDSTPWSPNSFVTVMSQSRTKSGKRNAARENIILVTANGRRQVPEVKVMSRVSLRDSLVSHLELHLKDIVVNLEAIDAGKPGEGGINVEGIVKWREKLFLGLRGPSSQVGGAFVISIENPAEVFLNQLPKFAKPIILPAPTGYGVRGMSPYSNGDVLIILGPEGDQIGLPFELISWNPRTGHVRDLSNAEFRKIGRPEALAYDGKGGIYVVQDLEDASTESPLVHIKL